MYRTLQKFRQYNTNTELVEEVKPGKNEIDFHLKSDAK